MTRTPKPAAVGFTGRAWNMILIFKAEDDFLSALEENSHVLPIFGHTAEDKDLIPGVFIAGIKANSQV